MTAQEQLQPSQEKKQLEELAKKINGFGWTRWWSYSKMAAALKITVPEVDMIVEKSQKVLCFKGWLIPKCRASEERWIPYSDDMADWLIQPL